MTVYTFNNHWLDAYDLGALRNHWEVLLLSTGFWFLLMEMAGPLTRKLPLTIRRGYEALDNRTKKNWDIHLVAFVHAIVVVILAAGILQNPHLQQHRVFGYHDWAGMTYAITCGYFLWDLVICCWFFQEFGLSFWIHAVLCFTAYLLSFRPFLQYHGAVFLMFEFSTIFLNIHWFLDKLKLTGSIYQLINGVLLVLSYVFVRVAWGWYMSYSFFQDMFANWNQIPLLHRVFYPSANITLNLLNVIWLYKILDALSRRFRSKPGSSKQE